MKITKIIAAGALAILWVSSAYAQGSASVYMEELTWMEIQDHLQSGTATAIIPTGSTQQQGPHLVTGEHNVIVRYTAGEIAKKLGHTLVAPVIDYAPSGRISPPEGHMQFVGTLSLSDHTYEMVLEDVARSLKQHGFRLICFIGDDAGSQNIQARLAQKLSQEWTTNGVKVLHVSHYYSGNGQGEWSDSMNIKAENPEAHGGLIETSELMAIDAAGVRDSMRANHNERDYKTSGAMGDSTSASGKLGRKYLSLKVEAAIKQIENASSHAE